MITPADIQKKDFSVGIRGYDKEEVDEFLDLLTLDLTALIAENASLAQQIERLGEDIEKYRSSENAVVETLEAAKSLMGDISGSAEKKAELLIKNAELDAELIKREARDSADRLLEEMDELNERLSIFKTKYRNLLEAELERFDSFSAELFKEFKLDDLKEAAKKTPATRSVTDSKMVKTSDIFGDVNKDASGRNTIVFKHEI